MIEKHTMKSQTDLEESQNTLSLKKKRLLKVCGMKHPDNIKGLMAHRPDFIGFIFYEKSSRFAEPLDEEVVNAIPPTTKKVGVFVRADITTVLDKVQRYGLDYVQLHGDESVEYIKELKEANEQVQIIKVFRVTDELPHDIDLYTEVSDLFLFDTATSNYGGSGKHFDWTFLKDYQLSVPYLLSGGISMEDLHKVEDMALNGLIGIDVNSKFEKSPADKNLEMIGQLKKII